MRTILTILFLTIANLAIAQKEPIPYEWFEEQSKIISDLQYKANGQEIDFGDNKIVTANYIKDNFNINFSDKLASVSVNFKANGNEGIIVVENIDLTSVKYLMKDSSDGTLLMFPSAEIEWQLYMGGEPTVEKDKFFYFRTANEKDSETMFAAFWHIINRLKVDKGLISVTEVEKQWQDWQNLRVEDFYIKYPKSILAHEYDDDALQKVGSKYYFEGKHSEALPWLQQAANLENGYANYLLGFMHYRGLGVDKDEKKAFDYYLKGAEQGDMNALIEVGNCYDFRSNIVTTNDDKAREYYQKAIDLGSIEAMRYMANSYDSGSKEAYYWYDKFLKSGGVITSGYYKKQIGQVLYLNQRYDEAKKYLTEGCKEDGCDSSSVAGYIEEIYKKGLGNTIKDKKAGRDWWRECFCWKYK